MKNSELKKLISRMMNVLEDNKNKEGYIVDIIAKNDEKVLEIL